MNYWIYFPQFTYTAIAIWLCCLVLQFVPAFKKKKNFFATLSLTGVIVMSFFLINLWLHLERPPIRTLGETRLWYSIFLPLIGILVFIKWRYLWLLDYSMGMASLFLLITLMHPEVYSKSLMPALQSRWFIPHVLVYIFAYAILAASSGVAVKGIFQLYKKRPFDKDIQMANQLVYLGFGFLSLGLLFGALWAKEAWGHYWTWDPKETWALLTWLCYLAYIHLLHRHANAYKALLFTLAVAFVVLLTCWFGVNYLPSAQQSVHTYSQS